MIYLELTPEVGAEKVFIVAESITICPRKNKQGCTIMDGKHNNGGWQVTESYSIVKRMINDQRGAA